MAGNGKGRSLREIWRTEEDKAAAPDKAKSLPFKRDQALKKTTKAFRRPQVERLPRSPVKAGSLAMTNGDHGTVAKEGEDIVVKRFEISLDWEFTGISGSLPQNPLDHRLRQSWPGCLPWLGNPVSP